MRSKKEIPTLEELTAIYANDEGLKELCKTAHKGLKARAMWLSSQSSSFRETQMRFQIDEQNAEVETNVKYQLVVCVKDTNQENGPGHVSCFVQKITIDGSKINHTSFYPGGVGCIVNGLSLGSIPVLGELAQSHEEDLEQSDHVMVATLTEDQYRKAREAQKEFKEGVDKSVRIYSVFGTANPVANGIKYVAKGARGANLVIEKHKQETSCEPPEDMCGIHVYDENHPKPPKIKVDNCTSSVTHVLQGAGFTFSNPKIPTFFTSELKKHGFRKVEKEEFMKEMSIL